MKAGFFLLVGTGELGTAVLECQPIAQSSFR
jgi:hypothetical protein